MNKAEHRIGKQQMTYQELWFEPVSLLDRCSLNEALLWVWADRVPVNNVYREKNVFDSLQDWECEKLNIPEVPQGVRRVAHYLTEERIRRTYSKLMPKDALEFHIAKGVQEAEAVRQWLPFVTAAIEVSAAELFLKLRRGEIETQGKLLPGGAAIIDFVDGDTSYGRSEFDNLTNAVIPEDFWTISGIDWIANAVTARGSCYCDVSLSVETLMAKFPGQRMPVQGAEFVGDFVLVHERTSDNLHQLSSRTRGRPPVFAWEAFHVEVAGLIKSERMPQKKEAAIQHMMTWFETTQGGRKPSRSAVSEKLTPYYRRFFAEKK